MAQLYSPSWISLATGRFPDRKMTIQATAVDLRTIVRASDLLPLREVLRADAGRHDLDFDACRYFINASRYDDFRVGRNCYTYSSITIACGHIELEENYGQAPGDPAIAAGDRLIACLLERGIPFRWEAYSYYADTGEGSEGSRGTESAFRLA